MRWLMLPGGNIFTDCYLGPGPPHGHQVNQGRLRMVPTDPGRTWFSVKNTSINPGVGVKDFVIKVFGGVW